MNYIPDEPPHFIKLRVDMEGKGGYIFKDENRNINLLPTGGSDASPSEL